MHMRIDIHGIPKRLSDPLGLNIHQAIVSLSVWVLATKLKSSDKVILSLNHWVILQSQKWFSNINFIYFAILDY